MKKLFLISCLAVGAAHARSVPPPQQPKGTQTTEDFDLGASSVEKVYDFVVKTGEVETAFRLNIIAHGPNSNPINTGIVSSAEDQEGAENPHPVHKVPLTLQSITSVEGKWEESEKSNAGYYLFVKGSRFNAVSEKDEATVTELKLTDSTGVFLEEIQVNEYLDEAAKKASESGKKQK